MSNRNVKFNHFDYITLLISITFFITHFFFDFLDDIFKIPETNLDGSRDQDFRRQVKRTITQFPSRSLFLD